LSGAFLSIGGITSISGSAKLFGRRAGEQESFTDILIGLVFNLVKLPNAISWLRRLCRTVCIDGPSLREAQGRSLDE
jgi:hypothetical protein